MEILHCGIFDAGDEETDADEGADTYNLVRNIQCAVEMDEGMRIVRNREGCGRVLAVSTIIVKVEEFRHFSVAFFG